MIRRLNLFLIVLSTLVLVTCHSSQRATRANLSYHYLNDPTVLQPAFKVFHKNESETELHVLINSTKLLYSKNNASKEFLSKMILQVHVYEADNINKLVLSDTVFLSDKGGSQEGKYLTGSVTLWLNQGSNYMAEVTFDDQNRMQFVQDVIFIDKINELSDQNFQVRDLEGNLQFESYFPLGTKLRIEKNSSLGTGIAMRYFKMQEKLPSPPFAQENIPGINYESDSAAEIEVINDRFFEVELSRKGVYHFQSDVSKRDGLTLLVLNKYFPYIKTSDAMLPPLRYITTRQEFDEIAASEDKKKSIDEFWFGIAGNAEKAKELIKTFYNRVELANVFFTSHVPGWKSDRGLIYMIYGPPNTVLKQPGVETWAYNEKNNLMSVEFTFYHVDNPFSRNDFYLSRSGGYKSSWYRSIDAWRQGRVF